MNNQTTHDPVLELEGVAKSYGPGVQVLDGAAIRLDRGQVAALVAPSGAGKSTLLHIAGLLDQPDRGRVRICGQDAGRAGKGARTALRRDRIGFVYQFHHLLPEFSAAENIILPQLAAGVARGRAVARAGDLLARVGLSDRADHRPAQLSGGEQQRVAFCRALANGPDLLLADEPTGNLDPGTAETVFELLLDMVRDEGMAALVATHNPDLAARMDRKVTLRGGALVEG